MTVKFRNYYFYRLLIIPNKQISLPLQSPNEELTKEEIVNGVIEKLASTRKTNIYHSPTRRYIIYSLNLDIESPNVYRFSLAKPSKTTIEQEGDDQVLTKELDTIDHINFIYYKDRQILLFEKKTIVFQGLNVPGVILKKYLQDILNERGLGLTIAVEEIPSSAKFWQHVKKADKIYEIELNINQLNIGEGNNFVRKLLTDLKNETNDDHVKISVRNEAGDLNAHSNFIEQAIDYIATVGGAFVLKYKEKLKKRKTTFRSKEAIKRTTFLIDNEQSDEYIINKISEDISDNDDQVDN